MPGRTQSREAWEGEKECAGRGPALTWGGTAGRALTLPSAVACLPTRSQPPARLRVPLHTWEIGLVFTVAGPDLCGLGERVACLPPVGLPVSMLTSPHPPRAQRWTRTPRGTRGPVSRRRLLCGRLVPECALCFRTQRCSGCPGSCPPAPQVVRAVSLLQTFGTQPARSGSRVCTPPTTTRPTPASWYETSRESLARGVRGRGAQLYRGTPEASLDRALG